MKLVYGGDDVTFDQAYVNAFFGTIDAERDDGLVTSHPIYVPLSTADEIAQYFDVIAYMKFDKQVVDRWRATVFVQDDDALLASHPIYFDFQSSDAINQYFDRIAYVKGSHVLRMLRNFMGADQFQAGMRKYIKKYELSNAKMADLWATLEETMDGKYDIPGIMNTWLTQMGYPVVHVTNTSSTTLSLSQERFLLNPMDTSNISESQYQYKWEIPFTYKTSDIGDTNDIVWMPKDGSEVEISANVVEDYWIVGNIGAHGFYLVNYWEENWNRLAEVLNSNHYAIDGSTRMTLINHAFMLARASKIDYRIPFRIASYLSLKEEEAGPWKVFLHHMSYISQMLARSDHYASVRKYILNKIGPVVESMGWSEEGNTQMRDIRIELLNAALKYGHGSTQQHAYNFFANWRTANKSIPANFRGLAYQAGAMSGNNGDWDYLFEYAQRTLVASDRHTVYDALATTKEPWLLQRYLNYALNGTVLKKWDFSRAIGALGHGLLSRTISFNFMLSNWKTIEDKFGGNPWAMDKILREIVMGVNTEDEQNKLSDILGEESSEAVSTHRRRPEALTW
ncbi:PREDICTED: glutamyl aminopeptidase-like [Priapulus caudatus]|uniref:Glutamyl aminopeptidase-like n=1 Tax=Priapulus caudatus TaxID=37621 RepID=A0ABM1DU79_PRICU|nr:PREDICTED: glutamyl aminopeptidase-like [Priapulus caudatus]